MTTANDPVQNPTWYANIREMFNATDIAHMQSQGLDLTSYDAVKNSAGGIYSQVSAGTMPPGAPWSSDQVTTFLNWISNGYPKGTPAPQAAQTARGAESLMATATTASRIRKEITSLSSTELDALKAAFEGIMAKDLSDPNSYFVQAGYHWLPQGNLFCQHHVPAYNPWHRGYMVSFENALRSVPGCENVTLPYWDITTPFPDVLKSAPFDSYTLPIGIGEGYNQGYVTERFDYATIAQNMVSYGVLDDVNRAMTQTDWEDFHGYWSGATYNTIIAAHDGGHVSIGPTMAAQSVAAFDPIFWFFHCNWDRLFWNWQVQMQATNLNGLLTTINQTTDSQSYAIFTNPVLEGLMMKPFNGPPLNYTTLSIIDSVNSLDVDYENPAAPAAEMVPKTQKISLASDKFSVDTNKVNVSVQGLNRLKIPGSFSVHLVRDGETIASKAFFQPNEVEKCDTCVQNAIAHFDFELPVSEVSKGKLDVWVEPLNKSFVGDRFPNKLMDNPTVEVNFLVSNG